MPYSIQLPDGTLVENIPDEVTPAEAKRRIIAQHPELGGQKRGYGAALAKGTESMGSRMYSGIAGLFGDDPEAAAREGLERGQDISNRYAEQVSLDKLKDVYNKKGLFSAAGEALSQVPYAIAEQAPNLAAMAGSGWLGAKAGAGAGSLIAPGPGTVIGGVVGGIGGALAPSLLQHVGGNIERQAQEGQPVDRSGALAAALPQAGLDVAGTLIPLGGAMVSKLTGIPLTALMSSGSAAKLAEESLLKTLAKGTAIGAGAEIPTEVVQQMLERAQAGLSLTDASALKEYGDTAYQVGLLAPIGAAGRLHSKGVARDTIAQENEQIAEQELKQQAVKQATQLQDPVYRQGLITAYQDSEKVIRDLQAQIKKGDGSLTPAADKAHNAQIREQLQAAVAVRTAALDATKRAGIPATDLFVKTAAVPAAQAAANASATVAPAAGTPAAPAAGTPVAPAAGTPVAPAAGTPAAPAAPPADTGVPGEAAPQVSAPAGFTAPEPKPLQATGDMFGERVEAQFPAPFDPAAAQQRMGELMRDLRGLGAMQNQEGTGAIPGRLQELKAAVLAENDPVKRAALAQQYAQTLQVTRGAYDEINQLKAKLESPDNKLPAPGSAPRPNVKVKAYIDAQGKIDAIRQKGDAATPDEIVQLGELSTQLQALQPQYAAFTTQLERHELLKRQHGVAKEQQKNAGIDAERQDKASQSLLPLMPMKDLFGATDSTVAEKTATEAQQAAAVTAEKDAADRAAAAQQAEQAAADKAAEEAAKVEEAKQAAIAEAEQLRYARENGESRPTDQISLFPVDRPVKARNDLRAMRELRVYLGRARQEMERAKPGSPEYEAAKSGERDALEQLNYYARGAPQGKGKWGAGAMAGELAGSTAPDTPLRGQKHNPTERTFPVGASRARIRDQLATLPKNLYPEDAALVKRIQDNLEALTSRPEDTQAVSDWLYKVARGEQVLPEQRIDRNSAKAGVRAIITPRAPGDRTALRTGPDFEARDISRRLDDLERGKRSESETAETPESKVARNAYAVQREREMTGLGMRVQNLMNYLSTLKPGVRYADRYRDAVAAIRKEDAAKQKLAGIEGRIDAAEQALDDAGTSEQVQQRLKAIKALWKDHEAVQSEITQAQYAKKQHIKFLGIEKKSNTRAQAALTELETARGELGFLAQENTPPKAETRTTRGGVQADMFPELPAQGTGDKYIPATRSDISAFRTPEEFSAFMAGEGLANFRKSLGLTGQTMARIQRLAAPIKARIDNLRSSIAAIGKAYETRLQEQKGTAEAAAKARDAAVLRLHLVEARIDSDVQDLARAMNGAKDELQASLDEAAQIRAEMERNVAEQETLYKDEADFANKLGKLNGMQDKFAEHLEAERFDKAAKLQDEIAKLWDEIDATVETGGQRWEAFTAKQAPLEKRLAFEMELLRKVHTEYVGAQTALEQVSLQLEQQLGVPNLRQDATNKEAIAAKAAEAKVETAAAEVYKLPEQTRALKDAEAELAALEATAPPPRINAPKEEAPPTEEELQADRHDVRLRQLINGEVGDTNIPGLRLTFDEHRYTQEALETAQGQVAAYKRVVAQLNLLTARRAEGDPEPTYGKDANGAPMTLASAKASLSRAELRERRLAASLSREGPLAAAWKPEEAGVEQTPEEIKKSAEMVIGTATARQRKQMERITAKIQNRRAELQVARDGLAEAKRANDASTTPAEKKKAIARIEAATKARDNKQSLLTKWLNLQDELVKAIQDRGTASGMVGVKRERLGDRALIDTYLEDPNYVPDRLDRLATAKENAATYADIIDQINALPKTDAEPSLEMVPGEPPMTLKFAQKMLKNAETSIRLLTQELSMIADRRLPAYKRAQTIRDTDTSRGFRTNSPESIAGVNKVSPRSNVRDEGAVPPTYAPVGSAEMQRSNALATELAAESAPTTSETAEKAAFAEYGVAESAAKAAEDALKRAILAQEKVTRYKGSVVPVTEQENAQRAEAVAQAAEILLDANERKATAWDAYSKIRDANATAQQNAFDLLNAAAKSRAQGGLSRLLEHDTIEDHLINEKGQIAIPRKVKGTETAAEKKAAALKKAMTQETSLAERLGGSALGEVGAFPSSEAGNNQDDYFQRATPGPNDTPLKLGAINALGKNNLRAALGLIAANAKDPMARRLAALFGKSLGDNVRVDLVDEIPGHPDAPGGISRDGTHILLARSALSEESLLHEVAHALTLRNLLVPDSALTADQRAAKRELEAMNALVKKELGDSNIVIQKGDILEFVAEAYGSNVVRAQMGQMNWVYGTGSGAKLSNWAAAKEVFQASRDSGDNVLKAFARAAMRLIGVPLPPTGPARDRFMQLAEKFLRAPETGDVNVGGAEIGHLRAASDAAAFVDRAGMIEKFRRITPNGWLATRQAVADQRAALREMLSRSGTREQKASDAWDISVLDAAAGNTITAMSYGVNGHASLTDVLEDIGKFPGIKGQDAIDLFHVQRLANRADAVAGGWDTLFGKAVAERNAAIAAAARTRAKIAANPALRAAVDAANERYNDYNRGKLEKLRDSGALDEDIMQQMLADANYVPFYRNTGDAISLLMPDGHPVSLGDIRSQPFLRALKGGDQSLLEFMDAETKNAFLLTSLADENIVKQNIAKRMAQMGLARPAHMQGGRNATMTIRNGYGRPDANKIEFRVRPEFENDDGKRHLIIDTEGTIAEDIPSVLISQAVAGSYSTPTMITELSSGAANMLRTAVTRFPLYTVKQLFRDPISASIQGNVQAGPAMAVVKSLLEYGKIMANGHLGIAKSAEAEILRKHGIIHSDVFTNSNTDLSKIANQISGGAGGWRHKMAAWLDKSAMAADAATRTQAYKDVLKKGGSETEALLQAREVQNFSRRGSSATIQFFANSIPFFNSGIVGLDTTYRSASGKMPNQKLMDTKRKFYTRAVGMMGVAAMYYAIMNEDDEWRKLSLRDKMSYIHLPVYLGGERMKLPAPFEVGMLFYSLPIAMMEAAYHGLQPGDWDIIRKVVVAQFPGGGMPIPQVGKIVIDPIRNYDSGLGKPIVPLSQQDMAVEEQYGPGTTEMARRTGELLNVSPYKVDYILGQFFGQWNKAAAMLTDDLFQNAVEADIEKPTKRLSETPLSSIVQSPRSNADMEHMYAAAKEAGAVYTTWNMLINTGQEEKAREYGKKHKAEISIAPTLNGFVTQLGEMKRIEQIIRNLPRMSADEKRKRIDDLRKQEYFIAQQYNVARRNYEAARGT